MTITDLSPPREKAAYDPALVVRQDLFLFHWQPPEARELPLPQIEPDPPATAGLLARIPTIATANRLTRPDQPDYPLQMRSGILQWLELNQARVLYLPASEEPIGIVGPYDNGLSFPYGILPQFSEELLRQALQSPDPPEAIGLLAPPEHKPYRFFLTERARFRLVRSTDYSDHENGMNDLPLPLPELWTAPERQPGPGVCALRLALIRRELGPLENRERIEQRHLDNFRAEPRPNKGRGSAGSVKTRQLNKSRRELEHTLAERARIAAKAAEAYRREVEYWQARTALPAGPEPWRQFIKTRILPGLRARLLRIAYQPQRKRELWNKHLIHLDEDSDYDQINKLTRELLLWQRELDALPPEPQPGRPTQLHGLPLPGEATAAVEPGAKPSRPRRPNLNSGNSSAAETIAHSARLEQAIKAGRRNPESLLRELDEELLPGIVAREQTTLNQAAIERHISRTTSLEYREYRAAHPVPGSGFIRPADYWQSLRKDEARFRRYWASCRADLLAAAQARREGQEPQWPPPPPLAGQCPALDPDRNPILRQLEAGHPLFPPPGGPTDYWYHAGLELQPDPTSRARQSRTEPAAYILRDRDSGQILGRFRLEKRPGRQAGYDWNQYDHRNQLMAMAQSPERLWEAAILGAIATAGKLRARRQLQRMQLLNFSKEEILDRLGLELTPPAGPAILPPRGGCEYRELRRQADGEILWELTLTENSRSEYQLHKETHGWRGFKPSEQHPGFAAGDLEALLYRLLAESLEAGETAGSDLPERL